MPRRSPSLAPASPSHGVDECPEVCWEVAHAGQVAVENEMHATPNSSQPMPKLQPWKVQGLLDAAATTTDAMNIWIRVSDTICIRYVDTYFLKKKNTYAHPYLIPSLEEKPVLK